MNAVHRGVCGARARGRSTWEDAEAGGGVAARAPARPACGARTPLGGCVFWAVLCFTEAVLQLWQSLTHVDFSLKVFANGIFILWLNYVGFSC